MRFRWVLLIVLACAVSSAALTYAVLRFVRPQAIQARRVRSIEDARACQLNFRAIDIAAQAYFAQNKAWPANVTDMLPPGYPQATTPASMKGGQLTRLPVCPFDTPTDPKPYNLLEIREDPTDAWSPVVGVLTDWRGHWANPQWSVEPEHLP